MRRHNWRRHFESLEHRYLLAADLEGLQINEFVAVNQASLETRLREEPDDRFRGDALTPDWVELYNSSPNELDLTDASLTDDPKHLARWTLPAGAIIPSQGYLVVFLSGVDVQDTRLDESERLHANFKLEASGEYFALLDGDGNVIDSVDDFPRLDADLAYGRDDQDRFAFLQSPTPEGPNSAPYLGEVSDTEFSVNRGFYSQSFDVVISTATPDAEIRYTTDGSEPSLENGSLYTGPVEITTTTNLRAAAFKPNYVPTDVDTQTYVFVADVMTQPAEIEGFPFGGRVWAGQSVYVPQDTEMDPDIVNDPAYADIMDDALLAIPTLSITSNQAEIFGDQGWYDGEDIEHAVSVELLYPNDAASNQQINAGIESHSHDRLKRSLRLNFREEYGDSVFETDFFQRSPVNGDSATNAFNAIILRGGNNRSWARVWNPDKTAYAIDEFYRSSQVAMSGYGMRGQVAHLFINGVYWGLYNPVERADQHFGSEYFGGNDDDWFTLNHGGDLAGNDDRWDELRRLARDDMTIPENYEALQDRLNLESFIDYLIISWWTAVSDWPQNNYYGNNRNESPHLDADPFRFVAWDGEWSWGQGGASSSNGRAHVHSAFRSGGRGGDAIPSLWHAARQNPQFMNLFHDRVYQHTHGRGALTDEAALARWQALTEMVREAVVAESARWGDSLEAARRPTRTRDVDWQREVDRVAGLIDGNNTFFLRALRREEYYPDSDPPALIVDGEENFGGQVETGTHVAFQRNGDEGQIYVGLDGIDPRAVDGTVSPTALEILDGQTLVVDRDLSVTVRLFQGGVWSAANFAAFATTVDSPLTITEFDFNPSEPTAEEISVGLVDNDMFEFIELKNRGDHSIDLSDYEFDDGIQHELRGTIAPGETVVLPRYAKAFRLRYGEGSRIIGEYPISALSNGGEKIRLRGPHDDVIFEFEYDDEAPWPDADGNGRSLHRIDDALSTTSPTNWRAAVPTPGAPGTVADDLNRDGVVNAADIDHLCAAVTEGDERFDLNADGAVDAEDYRVYVEEGLMTFPGDANLDRIFNSTDLVTVFRNGQYEDQVAKNSGWADGDWNCDGDFTSTDLVDALKSGAYSEAAARDALGRNEVAMAILALHSMHDHTDDEIERERGPRRDVAGEKLQPMMRSPALLFLWD